MPRLSLAVLATIFLGGSPAGAQKTAPPPALPTISNADASGSRLWILLFDTSSIASENGPRAKASALRWIDSTMQGDDLVAVMTVNSGLTLAQNFTSNRDQVRAAVTKMTMPPDGPDPDSGMLEQDFFNNDLRLRGLRTLCQGIRGIEKKKAIVFFTAGRDRPGLDNEVELRAATDACGQANTSISPVDVRGPGRGAGSRR